MHASILFKSLLLACFWKELVLRDRRLAGYILRELIFWKQMFRCQDIGGRAYYWKCYHKFMVLQIHVLVFEDKCTSHLISWKFLESEKLTVDLVQSLFCKWFP